MRLPTLLILGAALLCACAPQTDERGERESRAGEGRAETQGIRNTENLGVSGNAIGAQVDAALDANEQRHDALDRQLEAQE